jgi:hypothetical protein
MEVMTGQRDMDATGLLDYFSPLADWLERDNRQSGEYIGWEPTEKRKDPLWDILDRQFREGGFRLDLLVLVIAGCVQTPAELESEAKEDETQREADSEEGSR